MKPETVAQARYEEHRQVPGRCYVVLPRDVHAAHIASAPGPQFQPSWSFCGLNVRPGGERQSMVFFTATIPDGAEICLLCWNRATHIDKLARS